MFETVTLSSANSSRRAWTTGLGFLGEAALVASAILIPIIWPAAIPRPQALLMLLTPPAPVAPAHTTTVKPRAAQESISRIRLDPTMIPRIIPARIAMAVDDPPPLVGGIAGAVSAGDRGLLDGIIGAGPGLAPPPKVTPPASGPKPDVIEPPKRVRIS